MTLSVFHPGLADLRLEHLLLDANGTLTNRGALITNLASKFERRRGQLDIRLVSADVFGTLDSIAELLRVGAVRAGSGEDKLRVVVLTAGHAVSEVATQQTVLPVGRQRRSRQTERSLVSFAEVRASRLQRPRGRMEEVGVSHRASRPAHDRWDHARSERNSPRPRLAGW